MSDFIRAIIEERLAFIAEERTKKAKNPPFSLTLSQELATKIDAFSDYFGIARQNIALYCIKSKINEIEDELGDVFIAQYKNSSMFQASSSSKEDAEPRVFLVNIACEAGYGDKGQKRGTDFSASYLTFSAEPWRAFLSGIRKGDYIFFYQNGAGLVAHARASGIIEENGEEHRQKLADFSRLSSPLHSDDLCDLLEENPPFFLPLIPLFNGQKLLDYLKLPEEPDRDAQKQPGT